MGNLKIKAVLRPNKADKFGLVPIAYRFTKNRKSNYIFSGLKTLESEWNHFEDLFWERKPTIQYFKSRRLDPKYNNDLFIKEQIKQIQINPLAKSYNEKITEDLTKFHLEVRNANVLQQNHTAKSFKTLVKGADSKSQEGSFVEYWKKREKEFVKSESSTWRVYADTLKIFLNFTNQKDIKFSDIDIDFVNDLKAYLSRQRKKDGITPWSEAYIHKVLKTARSVYNQAIKDSVYETDKNPFTSRIAQPKNFKVKDKLTAEEIMDIAKLDLEPNSSMWHTRNCFIFGILNGGMRIGDILLLKWENIKDSRIEYKMEKNKKISVLELTSQAEQILNLYRTSPLNPKSYIFPFLAGSEKETDFRIKNRNKESQVAYINKLLKEISKLSNINKVISTHVGRHSYTNLVLQSGGNATVLQSILKHGSLSITEGYIGQIDTSEIDNTHKNALKSLNLKMKNRK